MEIEITGTPKFHFAISKEDLAVLMTLSRHHYDGHCRSYSKSAAEFGKNGLLVIWEMGFLYPAENVDVVSVSASWNDLDTLLKCLEMPQCLHTDEEQERASKLRMAFLRSLNEARAVQATWVHKFETQVSMAANVAL